MPSLSTPIGKLQGHYGVVVVGSGYGASVAACRMAELACANSANGTPAFSVALLERGLEIATGDYPSSLTQVARQIQVDSQSGHVGSPTALFDLRLNNDIGALIGCGLGGGSLINAGVMLEPLPTVFDNGCWPSTIKEDLASCFQRARRELRVVRVPNTVELQKVTQLFAAAKASLTWSRDNHPPVAVSFRTRVNHRGVQQKACVLCGDCMTGCNHSAKNTLVMNYLPAAANAGASIFCRMDVRAVERGEDCWHVRVRRLDAGFRMFGSPELTIRADAVFLGAGSLGSVEILLRSRNRGLALSSKVGQHFSGNGDVIAFAYNAPEPVNGFGYGSYVPPDAAVGPLIAGMLNERSQASGAMLQEGTVPGALTPLLRFASPIMARVSRRPVDLSADVRLQYFRRELDSVLRGVRHGALRRTQTFLGMGIDKARGTMRLRRDRLRIDWPRHLEADDEAIPRITQRMAELTRGMKARYLVNPFWARVFGRRRVTVHPLGGARIAERAEDGVVNAYGQVFDGPGGTKPHPGLYVCDGAVMPCALGTNPALTITAVAERIATRAAEPVAALTAAKSRCHVPTDRVAHVSERVRPSVPGIEYAERLRGRIHVDGAQSRFTLVLHISAENVRALIERPEHEASLIGVLTAPDLPEGYRRFTVSNGRFNVMVDDPARVDSKLVKYAFTLTPERGEPLTWSGQKTITRENARKGLWRLVSSYDFTICRGTDEVGHGTARSTVMDAIRMRNSMRITHERSWIDRQIFKAAYRWFFVKSVLNVLVRPLAGVPADPYVGASKPHVLEALQHVEQSRDAIRDDKRPGRPRFELTPYRSKLISPNQGAVILAPGFGMSADAFLLKDSLTQHLCELGYEVWLLDYRASDRLAASLEQFTLDDLAVGSKTLSGDFPDAIDAVVKANGGKPVHVIAHCVASLTMFMALLDGRLTKKQIRSVILSQSFACIDHPWLNRFKAWVQLPTVLRYFRFITVMSPDYDVRSGWRSRMLDRALRLYPTGEPCSSGMCRRLLLMYGEVVRHDQLTKGTHDLLYHLFDRANMTTFVHLSRMIAKGRIVDSNGRDRYLTAKNGGNLDVPITLLQGARNTLFRPRGGRRTIDWLHRHGPFGARNKEMFQLVPVPEHGHLDTFIGKNAKAKVYPIIERLLAEAPSTGL